MKRSLTHPATVALLCAGALVTASAAMSDETAFASRLHQTRTADGVAVEAASGDLTLTASESDVLVAGGPAVSVSYVGYRSAPPPPSRATRR